MQAVRSGEVILDYQYPDLENQCVKYHFLSSCYYLHKKTLRVDCGHCDRIIVSSNVAGNMLVDCACQNHMTSICLAKCDYLALQVELVGALHDISIKNNLKEKWRAHMLIPGWALQQSQLISQNHFSTFRQIALIRMQYEAEVFKGAVIYNTIIWCYFQ